jgi:hypothetical protein
MESNLASVSAPHRARLGALRHALAQLHGAPSNQRTG